MKRLKVVCMVAKKDGRVLLFRRAQGAKNQGLWEFPGGKIQAGEGPKEALQREIREELSVGVVVGAPLNMVRNDQVELHPFFVESFSENNCELQEHDTLKWVGLSDLQEMDLLPLDYPIAIDALKRK